MTAVAGRWYQSKAAIYASTC